MTAPEIAALAAQLGIPDPSPAAYDPFDFIGALLTRIVADEGKMRKGSPASLKGEQR